MRWFNRSHDDRTVLPVKQDTGGFNTQDVHLWRQLLGITSSFPAHYVSAETVVGLPGLDAAVNLIASGVSQMMVSANVYDSNGNEITTPLIIKRPNALMTSTEFWFQAVRALLVHGNYIALNYQDQLVPVNPAAVSLDTTRGLPLYTIGDRTYSHDSVLHVRKDNPPGSLWGLGVLAKFNESLETQLAEQRFGKTSFTNGSAPTGIISLKTKQVTQEQADYVKDQWTEKTEDGRQVIVLPGDSVDFKPLSWSPVDADYANSKAISIAEAALMVGLKPSDLEASVGGKGMLTYANLEQRQLTRIVDTFAPIMLLMEEAFSDLLPDDQYVKAKPEAILRTTIKERLEVYKLQQELGILTIDETRALENMAPAPIGETDVDGD